MALHIRLLVPECKEKSCFNFEWTRNVNLIGSVLRGFSDFKEFYSHCSRSYYKSFKNRGRRDLVAHPKKQNYGCFSVIIVNISDLTKDKLWPNLKVFKRFILNFQIVRVFLVHKLFLSKSIYRLQLDNNREGNIVIIV